MIEKNAELSRDAERVKARETASAALTAYDLHEPQITLLDQKKNVTFRVETQAPGGGTERFLLRLCHLGGYNREDLTDMWAFDVAGDEWHKLKGAVPRGWYTTADIVEGEGLIILTTATWWHVGQATILSPACAPSTAPPAKMTSRVPVPPHSLQFLQRTFSSLKSPEFST